jgi:hypothetical protein
MFGGIILLGDNIIAIIWLFDNINVIIWLDDNILLFDRNYDRDGMLLDVSSGWRIKLQL